MTNTTTTNNSNTSHKASAREQFRAKLTDYRRRTGMSQGALARAVGFSQNRFSERLNGRDNAAMFTIPEVVAIVRYLDAHNAFFTGNERADLLYTAYPQATSTDAPAGLAAPAPAATAAAAGYADDGSSSNNSGNSNPCQVILSATTTTTITTTATFTLNATSTNALDSLPETATARAGAGCELSDDFDFGQLIQKPSPKPAPQLQIQIQEETLRELARLISQHLAAAQVQGSGAVVTSLSVVNPSQSQSQNHSYTPAQDERASLL